MPVVSLRVSLFFTVTQELSQAKTTNDGLWPEIDKQPPAFVHQYRVCDIYSLMNSYDAIANS